MFSISEKEQGVAAWAFRFGKAAGRFTDNLPSAEAIYMPLATNRGTAGVLAVKLPGEQPPTLEQRDLLDAFARQTALVLDRFRLDAEAEQARLLAESEKLSKALLNSISHELRTPISAITAAASTLAGLPPDGQPGLQKTLAARNPGKRRPPQPPGRQFAGHDAPGVRQGQAAPGMVRSGRPGQRRLAAQSKPNWPATPSRSNSPRACPWCGWILC